MSKQHYTSNTVSVSAWCNKCSKFTQYAVSHGRKSYCLDCVARYDAQPKVKKPEAPVQENLFG